MYIWTCIYSYIQKDTLFSLIMLLVYIFSRLTFWIWITTLCALFITSFIFWNYDITVSFLLLTLPSTLPWNLSNPWPFFPLTVVTIYNYLTLSLCLETPNANIPKQLLSLLHCFWHSPLLSPKTALSLYNTFPPYEPLPGLNNHWWLDYQWLSRLPVNMCLYSPSLIHSWLP